MIYEKTKISDCVIIRPKVFHDNRGSFFEAYSSKNYLETFINEREGPGNPLGSILIQSQWRQTNCSVSAYGVVRGIHIVPFAKLVTCLHGHVWDVVVDMRPESPTYLQWVGVGLDSPTRGDQTTQIYVPPGCGHGFFSYEDDSVVMYAQTGIFDPKVESSVNWRDKKLDIKWPFCSNYILSPKDEAAPHL